MRRAELKAALASLWRFAVRTHVAAAPASEAAEAGPFSSGGSGLGAGLEGPSAAAATSVSVAVHVSLAGVCGGLHLDRSLTLHDLRRALETLGDGATTQYCACSCFLPGLPGILCLCLALLLLLLCYCICAFHRFLRHSLLAL